jgi:uncharacterized protein YjbJ (UPF0337 family)
MMINETILKGKWQELKGDVQKQWGKLTSDDLEKAKGDLEVLVGSIQQRYGLAKEEARKHLNEWFAKTNVGPTEKIDKQSPQ